MSVHQTEPVLAASPQRPSRFAEKTGLRVRFSSLLCVAFLASCGGGSGGSLSSPSPRPAPGSPSAPTALLVTTSLRPGSVLTAPLTWTAEVRPSGVEKVDFLIDGKVRWTERNAPYFFNDDGQLLVPWLLSPGVHEFTARATGTDGQTGEAVARLRTHVQGALPDGLVGTFSRTVNQADVDRTASHPGRQAQSVPTGRWVMHVKNGLLTFDDPMGSGGAEAVSATTGKLQMFGSPNWLLPEARRGGFCESEPPASFNWSRTGQMLLISGGGNCADRDAVFVGTWQRQR